MPDPSIPDSCYSALFAYEEDRTRVSPEETIQAIAAPLIAAELRRARAYFLDHVAESEAEGDPQYAKALKDMARDLRRRADDYAPEVVELNAADGRPV